MKRAWSLLGALGLVCAVGVIPASADVLADWNICSQPIITTGRSAIQFGAGPSTQLDLALMHLAMHDAVQAFDRRFESYAGPIDGGVGSAAAAAAAAAKAAQTYLSARFPAAALTTIKTCYDASMTGIVLSVPELAHSNTVGMEAANRVLALRNGDFGHPANPITPFTGGGGPGKWTPNPGTASMVAPWLGAVHPLALVSLQRCQADALPALTSVEYAEAYNEVKAVGSVGSTTRTPEQGHIGRTFSGNFAGQFNRLIRELAAAHIGGSDLASLGDRGRLYALANLSAADAIICAWSAKKSFAFWRPDRAIRAGDTDGNYLTDVDPTWTPYMSTPNYPDYTSGGNNFSGSMMRALELFFDSDKPFEDPFRIYYLAGAVPLLPNDLPYREFSRFSDIAKEVIDARIYLGIHFRFADTEARSQGRRVANYVFKNYLTPIR
jgi:hypothetical protein